MRDKETFGRGESLQNQKDRKEVTLSAEHGWGKNDVSETNVEKQNL